MKKRNILKGAIVALTVAVLPMTALAQDKLRVAYLKIPPLVHMVHALEAGIFEENGLDVELTIVNGGPELMTALASGSVDVGMTAVQIVLLARAKGLPLKAFGTADPEAPDDIRNWIVATEESGINDFYDLEGRTVGVVAKASPAELTFRSHMLANGADPDTLELVALPFPQLPAALEVGNVDAIHVGEPFFTQIMASDKVSAKVLGEGLLADMNSQIALGGWFAQDSWLEEEANRDIAARFLRSILQANRELTSNRQLVNSILEREFGMPPEVAANTPLPLETNSLVAIPAAYQASIDALVETGMLDEAYPAEEVVDVITYE